MNKPAILLTIFTLLIMLNSCDDSPSEETIEPQFTFLVGTYTDSEDQGIQLLSFDPDNNTLRSRVIAEGINNPSFVIANKAKDLVFAVNESSGKNGGKINSFRFDAAKDSLQLIATLDSYGDNPCYLTLNPSEEFLIAGNYSGGNLSVFKIENGELNHVQTIQHEGNSIIGSRQENPHVHSAVFHPNGKQLLVGDLGTDKIHIYDFHPDYAVPFSPASPAYYEVEAGSGPRHLAVHPNGNKIYLVHELTADLGVYDYDEGVISRSQVLPLTSDDFAGAVGAAEVRISHDSEYVYVSNRGDANEITVFEIGNDGNLTFVQRISTGGKTPRNFILSPDGNHLLVGNQDSNEIRLFNRNPRTGMLSATDVTVEVHKPVYFHPLR